MKKVVLSLVSVLALSTAVYAGGGKSAAIAEEPMIAIPDFMENSGIYVGIATGIQRTYGHDYQDELNEDPSWFADDVYGQDKTYPIIGILGYDISDCLAVEGRISKTLWAEDYADVTTYSLFLKPKYAINDDITIYALGGYGVVDVKGANGHLRANKFDGQTISNEGSLQGGFGAFYNLSEKLSIFIDYTLLLDEVCMPIQPLYEYENSNGATVKAYDRLSNDVLTVGITYKL